MEDNAIISLYFERDEAAITETEKKYGAYCRTIADNILGSSEDTEDCVNDAMLRLWNAIPPQRPVRFRLFLAKIVRNLAFDRYKQKSAEKRGSGEISAVLDELSECVADTCDIETELQGRALRQLLNEFVAQLPERERRIFLRRYFYADSMETIARELGMRANHCSVLLSRTRKKLHAKLLEEGFHL